MEFLRLDARDPRSWQPIDRLVTELRGAADAFVFLAGGASKMSSESQQALLGLLDALVLLADRPIRFAVGDGGTKAGLMEAAGHARVKSGNRFPLLGVAPAPEVTATGEPDKVPVDPNHSHVVAVRDPQWRSDGGGYWGSETEAMYTIFGRLAAGRPSVALVANGGEITVAEVRCNALQERRMLLIEGSGRATDAILSVLDGNAGGPDADARLRELAGGLDAATCRRLIERFPLHRGPAALAEVLAARLGPR